MTEQRFLQHYNSHQNALKSFAKNLTNDISLAQDLVQESLLKAYKYRNSFKAGTNFKNWVFTILRNTFYTSYRKAQRVSVVDAPIEDIDYLVSTERVTRNTAETSLSVDNITNLIKSLSPGIRIAFTMQLAGYKYKEIAEVQDVPLGTVKSRINFARTRLQKQIRESNAASR